jgi:hypothetical protein
MNSEKFIYVKGFINMYADVKLYEIEMLLKLGPVKSITWTGAFGCTSFTINNIITIEQTKFSDGDEKWVIWTTDFERLMIFKSEDDNEYDISVSMGVREFEVSFDKKIGDEFFKQLYKIKSMAWEKYMELTEGKNDY